MIPIIDLALIRRYPHDKPFITSLDLALSQTGFCYLKNHGIPPALIRAAQDAAYEFFSLPTLYKQHYSIAHAARHSGYVGFDENGQYPDEAQRLYEAYDIGLELPFEDPDFLAGNIFYGPNTWPDLPQFRPAVYGYYQAISQLAYLLTQSIEAALGLRSHTLTNLMRKPIAQLRLIHYPENQNLPRDAQTHTMMGAHTDYEFFTLLYQTKAGLQTVDRKGKWLDVPPLPDTLVMNVGDMAEVITAGRYRSNPHRVLNLGQERFSMPFFAAFDYQARIEPMLENLNPSYLTTLHSLVAGEHLLQQVRQDFAYLRMQAAPLNPTANSLEIAHLHQARNPFLKGKIRWTQ
ncbi:MAG: isopenicillin N synthase family oxygenase [Burkholderiales bacterium]|nr:isopenicillin N synthase family oxygenase [Burkholderiales bacterium]